MISGPARDVPYFSQWETPDLTLAVLSQGAAALLDDPLWRQSGAETIDEYARWAVNLCGMACLKMILATRGELLPIIDLAKACATYGGYVVNDADGSIKGLIYAPFVRFVEERFGLCAEVRTGVSTDDLPALLSEWTFFMASVHHAIRWPDREPPAKGGHLVLVTAASPTGVRFNNPSGHDATSRSAAELPLAVFDRFFANRGIAVSLSSRADRSRREAARTP